MSEPRCLGEGLGTVLLAARWDRGQRYVAADQGLVIVGEHDVAYMRSIAAHVADSVDGARLVEVDG